MKPVWLVVLENPLFLSSFEIAGDRANREVWLHDHAEVNSGVGVAGEVRNRKCGAVACLNLSGGATPRHMSLPAAHGTFPSRVGLFALEPSDHGRRISRLTLHKLVVPRPEVRQSLDGRLLSFDGNPRDGGQDGSKLHSDVSQRNSPTWALEGSETHLDTQLHDVAVEEALDVEVRLSRIRLQAKELDDFLRLLVLLSSLLHFAQSKHSILSSHLPGPVGLHGVTIVDGSQVDFLGLCPPVPGLRLDFTAVAVHKRHGFDRSPALPFADTKRGSPGLVSGAQVLLGEVCVIAEPLRKP
mmetsp:Transcript_120537/g.169561  ORF Transcript_120537/g.169561 Transcript_120537/m.169561 type:complete len:298 (+) Transcript_120537:578-1471(+)